MRGRKCLIVSVFLVSILSFSGMVFAQRVIDLNRVGGDMRVLGDDAYFESGHSVAYGDINGDGYMDIIIGSPKAWPSGRNNAGEVHVIFGSSNPPSTYDLSTTSANIKIIGDDTNGYCGFAVDSGNINGDGYDDIIIGAYKASPGRYAAGETYVIFGSSSPPSSIDLRTTPANITVLGDDIEDWSGHDVASGNINGDAYDDLIIGAPYADPAGGSTAGETYVIFGSSSPPSTIDLSTTSADVTVCGDDEWDTSGSGVSSGNVNGDAYDDIITGGDWASPSGRSTAGKAHVIFGSSFSSPPYTIDLNSVSADITILGDDAYDHLGRFLGSGDINGDNYDDVIIGAYEADPSTRTDAGKTYVIFGSSFSSPPYTIDLDTQSADITILGDDHYDLLGCAVDSGDVNGDGYQDLIIGAHDATPPGGSGAGETYVIFGSSSPPATIDLNSQSADITIYGDDAGDDSGYAVASGDVNGDAYDDVIICAPYADPGGRTTAGETYLISGGGAIIAAHGLGGTSQIRAFSLLGRKWSEFRAFGPPNAQGEVHLAVGDIDGDGLDEIAAGQGEGGNSYVKLLEMDGTFIRRIKAFGTDNPGGEVHLVIGNFDANPSDKEIAVAHGEGGQSWVKLFRANGNRIRKFTAFGPPNAQGEVHLAAGDLYNSGVDKIVAGMGEGGSSLVKIFNHMGTFIRKFTAFGPAGNPGGEVHVAVGNFDADAYLEIAVATGYNGGNWVKLFENDGTSIRRFIAFGPPNANGEVHLATADLDNDGVDEIIVGMGEGGSSVVRVFKANGTRIRSFTAFGGANSQGEVHLGKSNY